MMPTKPHCLSLLYICGLQVQAGDLHPNPGPISTSTPDFPCGICSQETTALLAEKIPRGSKVLPPHGAWVKEAAVIQ
ncbi:hypothetical protein NP493_683g02029 [Ridgeia piscesae]|uniref:Uncharacterized protein n=1 Tax=Ridgeia piscesae TaxID=27915 RepID=A0AAD9NMT8_RIDPI|nr:hypothetical protein NP493_683g02029 [Ridgeia piscesae]